MTETLADVGDEKQVKTSKKRHELKREHEIEDIKYMLKSPAGRYFLWRFLEYARVFNTISSDNVTRMSIQSGIRDAGLWVFNEIMEAQPDILNIMKQEAIEREK
jgi:hypothetical protein